MEIVYDVIAEVPRLSWHIRAKRRRTPGVVSKKIVMNRNIAAIRVRTDKGKIMPFPLCMPRGVRFFDGTPPDGLLRRVAYIDQFIIRP